MGLKKGVAMQEQDNRKGKKPLSHMDVDMAQEAQHCQAASQALSEPRVYTRTFCAAHAISHAF